MSIDYALVRKEFPKQKAALTRAKKKGPQAVINEVARFYAWYDERGWSYPDDWHRWDIAGRDAAYELQRQELQRGEW